MLATTSGGGSMTAEEVVRAELDAWSALDVDGIMTHFARGCRLG